MMKTGQRLVAMAFGGTLCLATNTGLSASESWSPATMKPMMAVSFDAGSKHVVSYFLKGDGDCKLTLMIGERSRDERDGALPQASRLNVAVEAGTMANLDNEDGKSLQFACKAGAQAMTATVVDRVAFYPAAKFALLGVMEQGRAVFRKS
jgi:hypothetical protein